MTQRKRAPSCVTTGTKQRSYRSWSPAERYRFQNVRLAARQQCLKRQKHARAFLGMSATTSNIMKISQPNGCQPPILDKKLTSTTLYRDSPTAQQQRADDNTKLTIHFKHAVSWLIDLSCAVLLRSRARNRRGHLREYSPLRRNPIKGSVVESARCTSSTLR